MRYKQLEVNIPTNSIPRKPQLNSFNNTNISTNSYTNPDILSSDTTAIQLKGNFSHCTVFSIYNDYNNNDTTTALQNYLNEISQTVLPSSTDHMLWFSNTTTSEKPTPIQHQENQKVLKIP